MAFAGDSPTSATKPIWKRPTAWIGGILGLCIVCTICTYAASGILLDQVEQAAQDTLEDGEGGEYLFLMKMAIVDFIGPFAEFRRVQFKAKQDESILNDPETRATLEEQFARLRSAAERFKELENVPENRADLHKQVIELSDTIIEFSNTYEGKLGEFDSQQLSDVLDRSREIQQQVNDLYRQLREAQ